MSQRTTAPKHANTARAVAADPYVAQVAARVNAELSRRVGTLRERGVDPDSLGDPDTLAARMLAAVPEPSPWSELGPFYSTTGIARVLGGISRQAVEERRRRRTILALRTADGVWVYPAFQLDDHNRVVRGMAEVLDRFQPRTADDDWMVASFLAAPQPGLEGDSVVDHLRAGGALAAVLDLAAERAQRWARRRSPARRCPGRTTSYPRLRHRSGHSIRPRTAGGVHRPAHDQPRQHRDRRRQASSRHPPETQHRAAPRAREARRVPGVARPRRHRAVPGHHRGPGGRGGSPATPPAGSTSNRRGGTCYLADDEVGAMLEVLGPILVVSPTWAARLRMWHLGLPHQCRAADTTVRPPAASGSRPSWRA